MNECIICFSVTYKTQVLLSEDDDLTDSGPTFDVESIVPPESGRPVTVPVNCGAKEVIAQVLTTVETASLPLTLTSDIGSDTYETRFTGCALECLVEVPRDEVCANHESFSASKSSRKGNIMRYSQSRLDRHIAYTVSFSRSQIFYK